MKIKPSRLMTAILLVGFLLSAPIWLPSLTALAAPEPQTYSNPISEASSFYVLDAGWTTGSLTQRVMAVPQVIAWQPGSTDSLWVAETGFLYGALTDSASGRIYITEQRSAEHESLLDLTFAGDVLYANNTDWPMYLTSLVADSGDVIDRMLIDLPARSTTGASLHPIAVDGSTLYLMNYAYRDNLLAFDLNSKQFNEQTWSLCEQGYIIETEVFTNPPRIAALCVGHENGTGSAITLTELTSGKQRSLELPMFGTEEYQTGNGIFSANGNLFALDSEAGVIVSIDIVTMQVALTSNYRDDLAQQTSWLDGMLNWMVEQIVQPAAAKRLSALTAVSPDGRWLVVDNSQLGSHESGREILLIDLQELEVKQTFELSKPPVHLTYSANNQVLAVFDKPSITANTPGVLLDLTTGEQQQVSLPTHGWILNLFPAQ